MDQLQWRGEHEIIVRCCVVELLGDDLAASGRRQDAEEPVTELPSAANGLVSERAAEEPSKPAAALGNFEVHEASSFYGYGEVPRAGKVRRHMFIAQHSVRVFQFLNRLLYLDTWGRGQRQQVNTWQGSV